MRVAALSVLVVISVAGCGGGSPGDEVDSGIDAADDGLPDDTAAISIDTVPCDEPQHWPHSIRSAAHPVIVHYRARADEAMAHDVLAILDQSWEAETGRLGFRPPLDDTGHCGPDGAFDVFLWRGSDGCYVDVVAENGATPYDDEAAFLVVDPWGEFGGPILDTTVAHELNHAMQAADDWSDAPLIYEATSVLIEDEVYDDDNQYVDQVKDFQAHPDWSLDRNDDYETWYMYGAGLYLRYLRDRHWGGDAAFIGEMWRRLRSPLGNDEPDFEDALEVMLRARAQIGFLDSVVGFARWRWYTGAHADAAHLEEAATFAEPARAGQARTAGGRVSINPMTLGSAYVDVTAQAGDPGQMAVSLENADPSVTWVVQVVPGAAGDGDILDLSAGARTVAVPAPRTVIVTALPRGADDADARTDARHAATVVIAPR